MSSFRDFGGLKLGDVTGAGTGAATGASSAGAAADEAATFATRGGNAWRR